MLSSRPAYCTQQTGGLTRGITSRAIQVSDADRPGKTWCSAPQPHHTTLRAIRYRAVLRGWAFRILQGPAGDWHHDLGVWSSYFRPAGRPEAPNTCCVKRSKIRWRSCPCLASYCRRSLPARMVGQSCNAFDPATLTDAELADRIDRLGSEGPSARKCTVRNENTDRIPTILAGAPGSSPSPAQTDRLLRAIMACNPNWPRCCPHDRRIARSKLGV